MRAGLLYLYHRVQEHLWAKPAAICALAVAGVFLAKAVDPLGLTDVTPDISVESIETLLRVIASSMLVMAVFAVGSMVSAYASASTTATPRTFPLIIADDVSQNAFAAFIGAFIFGILALFALQNGFYDRTGRFTLVLFTLVVFAVVILTFLSWVDRIARLGRMGATIEKVESAAAAALVRRRREPRLGGLQVRPRDANAAAIYGESIGYVQQVRAATLQAVATKFEIEIEVAALPGTFASPVRPLAYVTTDSVDTAEMGPEIAAAFVIGKERTFEEDPRFGLVVLAEIASRALSPGINDTGTAIRVIGSLVRLFALWCTPAERESDDVTCDRVAIPELALGDMLDDAFTTIARDGAGAVEVAVRLQKALEALAAVADPEGRRVAMHFARMSASRAGRALTLPEDLQAVSEAGAFAALEASESVASR